jgi:hypothetical protein
MPPKLLPSTTTVKHSLSEPTSRCFHLRVSSWGYSSI